MGLYVVPELGSTIFDVKELGDKLIYNDFTIGFELVAGK